MKANLIILLFSAFIITLPIKSNDLDDGQEEIEDWDKFLEEMNEDDLSEKERQIHKETIDQTIDRLIKEDSIIGKANDQIIIKDIKKLLSTRQ